MRLKKTLAAAAAAATLGLGAFASGIGVASADPGPWQPGPGHGQNDGPRWQGQNDGPRWQGGWNANNRYWAWRDWNNAPPWGWGPPPAAQWSGDWYPHPINYWGYNVNPYWNPDLGGWGFWLFGVWIPLVIV